MDYKHSPSSYDDRSSPNGPVKATHAAALSIPEAVAGGTDAGGTEALREDPQTKQADNRRAVSRGDKVPSGVDHYSDSGV